LILFILTEDLSVFSNLSILLLYSLS
jgi:hypothetical protein